VTDLPDVFDLDAHPAADVWPMLAADELDALAESIRTVGQLHPLVVWRDSDAKWWLLDGRCRREAMRMIDGIEPDVLVYEGDDPAMYVLGANEHRRHATPSQRAMAQALTVTRKVGGDHSANLQNGETTSALAAERAGTSTRLIDACRYVRDHAPELVDAVLAGTIKASAAEAEARRIVRAREQEAEAAKKRIEAAMSPEDIRQQAPDLAEKLADEDAEADKVAAEYRDRVFAAQESVRRWNTAARDFLDAVARLRTLVADDGDGGYVELAAQHGDELDRNTRARARSAQSVHLAMKESH